MLLGVFQLLLAKQAEVEAYRQYIESVRDYWIARAELERAVGTTLKSARQVQSELQPRSPDAKPAEQLSEVSP
jgi:cobalt-zinc-cadmium efflux system outer membrane protein